ncbi:MAG: 30S ribosomal protein S1 [Chloroflexi bacterium]|nr:30S ribosomal protein S1 [Chloroflexota bacterium]
MGEMGIWIPGNAPPDEGYWETLLRDGENGYAAPLATREVHVQKDYDQKDYDQKDYESSKDLETSPSVSVTPKHTTVQDQWQAAHEAMKQGKVVKLPIVGCNRGGVLVGWDGLRGFVPASHLLNLSPSADEDERQNELQSLVGSQLHLKIIELDPEQERFVLSERTSLLDESQRQELLDALCPGDICKGRVSNICSFGAFVDLGGLEGLVHVSELSWGRVDHPSDVLEKDQSVQVYVLNMNRKRGRVGLSIKRLQPDPWQSAEDRYQIGQTIEGIITHIVDFGAFARIEEGLEGLIHVSELAEGNSLHPRSIVRKGDTVAARVLNIDSGRRRMGLSLRQTETTTLW